MLTASCAETMPKKVSYALAQKCKLDKNLRYYLVYDVETAEQSDRAVLFLSYNDAVKLMKNKTCLMERTLKDKLKKIETPDSPRKPRDRYQDRMLKY